MDLLNEVFRFMVVVRQVLQTASDTTEIMLIMGSILYNLKYGMFLYSFLH